MTDVTDLIAKQKAMNTPPEEPAEPTAAQRLIEKAREAYENAPYEPVQVLLADEVVTIEIAVVRGEAWGDLEAFHPAKGPGDMRLGYNTRTLPRDYPVERLRVNGEPIEQEVWTDLYDCLPPEHQDNVHTVMWGLNVLEPQQRLKALKAG